MKERRSGLNSKIQLLSDVTLNKTEEKTQSSFEKWIAPNYVAKNVFPDPAHYVTEEEI